MFVSIIVLNIYAKHQSCTVFPCAYILYVIYIHTDDDYPSIIIHTAACDSYIIYLHALLHHYSVSIINWYMYSVLCMSQLAHVVAGAQHARTHARTWHADQENTIHVVRTYVAVVLLPVPAAALSLACMQLSLV